MGSIHIYNANLATPGHVVAMTIIIGKLKTLCGEDYGLGRVLHRAS